MISFAQVTNLLKIETNYFKCSDSSRIATESILYFGEKFNADSVTIFDKTLKKIYVNKITTNETFNVAGFYKIKNETIYYIQIDNYELFPVVVTKNFPCLIISKGLNVDAPAITIDYYSCQFSFE